MESEGNPKETYNVILIQPVDLISDSGSGSDVIRGLNTSVSSLASDLIMLDKTDCEAISSTNLNVLQEDSKYDYHISIQKVEVRKCCLVCKQAKIVKYNCKTTTEQCYICGDFCLDYLKEKVHRIFVQEYELKCNFVAMERVCVKVKFERKCEECGIKLNSSNRVNNGICVWEAMEFCKEACLYRYQRSINLNCAECENGVQFKHLGKYSVRFGSTLRQFCSNTCLNIRKKKICICVYCQSSIRRSQAEIGKKKFCDDFCKGQYLSLESAKKIPYLMNPKDSYCTLCGNTSIEIQLRYHHTNYFFCKMECFTIFKFLKNCQDINKCHTCAKYILQEYLEENAMYYDNLVHYFCSDVCKSIYIITHRKVLACAWCKVKKYNFDFIKKNNFYNDTLYTCSLYCLNEIKKNVEYFNKKKVLCYMCNKESGLYNILKLDGMYSAFCSTECITKFHFQKPKPPAAPPKRGRRVKAVLPDKPGPLPIITNVCSLAQKPNRPRPTEPQIKKIVVVKPQPIPMQRNMMTMVAPIKMDQECQKSSEKSETACQTDFTDKGLNVHPLLTPIYIPNPVSLWKAPVPHPVPFPLYIPCPVLIPLTINGSKHVLTEITKVEQVVKAPEDPFEAELLMMAELVAAEKKEEETAVVSEDENGSSSIIHETSESNAFGDDMLQIALKMASDYEEPPEDLEGALTINTITPITITAEARDSEDLDDPSPVEPIIHKSSRGRRRGSGRGRGGSRKNKKVNEIAILEPEEPEVLIYEHVEKPDANMCLKYTFGVNAWKQWVLTKNSELERKNRRPKLFKTEMLQLTADELNFSLCLFVKEVRKPNGSDYAPDTIYYLCLGVQQYLYESGRIDNIFCDPYYEQFTDCLDEICAKFNVLYNDSNYIVTRVEEEHLWESKQLGAHSPHVLLSTLMFFNTKHFNLTNVEEHMQLSFSHIMKHWKRTGNQQGKPSAVPRSVLLRFYPPQSSDENIKKKKVYEQQENEENPLRCPVKLYEFYLSKCPESVKTRNDVFYLEPERSCVPDSPVWYSTRALGSPTLEKMLHRVKMVKEINVALLTN